MLIRKKILITGIVQAVGFRPFVYNLANKLDLSGFAANTGKGIIIEAQGAAAALKKFEKEIKQNPPALSKIESFTARNIPVKKENSFKIKTTARAAAQTSVPADIALCQYCQKDISKKNSRRYHYPFTNCTNCGPRFTIIKNLPYDRAQTTMQKFKMCAACKEEFENPQDRRFHAQPNCCPVCGPQVFITPRKTKNPPLQEAAALIKKGKVFAVKSLGGFHLACNALNKTAVANLRARKNRPHKPLALMFGSMAEIKKYCFVNKAEEALLKSPQAPVVMLKKRCDIALISDGLYTFGVMLPYTPLHRILFDILGNGPLVMTSGNISGNPICIDNDDALANLIPIADAFLMHNRPIHNRMDDSVLFELNGKTHFLRRARGYTPGHITLHSPLKKPMLALGANLTNSFCLAKNNKLFLSQYIGDLDSAGNIFYFEDTLKKMQKLLNIRPQIFLRDAHPAYYGALYKPDAIKVQHHLAHALAIAAEHNIKDNFLCFAFDGAGFGDDNTIWGGEFLAISKNKWQRLGCFKPLKITGGDSAAQDIWKCGLSYMLAAGVDESEIKKVLSDVPAADISVAGAAAKNDTNCYTYSGAGRLFDAAASILGLCQITTYQAQGAMLLEGMAAKNTSKAFYNFKTEEKNKFIKVDTADIIKGLLAERANPALAAAKFHNTLARIILAVALRLGIKNVALGGGVFQNKILLARAGGLLKKAGFKVYTNNALPIGDGSVAVGQIYAKYRNFV